MPSCFPFSRLCGIQVWAVFNKPSSSACVKLGCKYWLLAWLGWRCLYGILSALKWVQSSPVARVSQPACESPWQDVREPNVTRNAKKKMQSSAFGWSEQSSSEARRIVAASSEMDPVRCSLWCLLACKFSPCVGIFLFLLVPLLFSWAWHG